MADFLTRFSCLLDVGSADNAARALDLYQAFMQEAAREEPPSDGFLPSIQPEHGATKLWIRDDATGDPQQALDFVLRCADAFGLDGRLGFQWASTCSHPRINAFGGGAQVLDLKGRTTVAWTVTNGWLARALVPGRGKGGAR
jgi:hypothetical protein